MIFNVSGGGGTALNFRVVGGTTAPSNAKENMIWVNTSTTISSWVFSATQPTAAAGKVWITIGTTSTVGFNALKKNGIQVYPLSAKQYIGGAWVDKTAKSWQGGAWVEWIAYVYKDGVLLAGNLIPVAKNWNGNGTEPTITHNEKSISITQPSQSQGYCYFEVKYDMTNFKTLRTTGSYTKNGAERCGPAILNSVGGAFGSCYVAYENGGETDISIDISSISGEKYIGFFLSFNTSITVSEVWLE
jgi:hypothetical protein